MEKHMTNKNKALFSCLIAGIVAACLASPAAALVVGQTDMSPFADPGSPWYGMNANYVYATGAGSSVAVGPYTLISASHYSMSVGTLYTLHGKQFEIISLMQAPNIPGKSFPSDLRLITLRNNTDGRPLPGYYEIYNGSVSKGRNLILVGTGHTGTSYTTYYSYDDTTPRLLRWGTNQYVAASQKFMAGSNPPGGWWTYAFSMDYDSRHTEYEVGLADHDSGSGTFINDNGVWKLLGVNLYVEPSGPGLDMNYAASLPDYYDWITANVSWAIPGDYNGDGCVDLADYTVWADSYGMTGEGLAADGNGDLQVDLADYTVWADHYGFESRPVGPPGGP